MIIRKDDDPIDKKPFDKCFTKSKIKYVFYKVEFVPFTIKYLSNPLVHH